MAEAPHRPHRSRLLDLSNDVPRRDREKILARIDEPIVLDAVLALVELAISSAVREQLAMRAALHDLTTLEHQDLIGALDRRKPVCDDERGSPATQRAEAVANH